MWSKFVYNPIKLWRWQIAFADNDKGKIIDTGTIGKEPSSILEDVLLVVVLKANHIKVSQLCDKEMDLLFGSSKSIIFDSRGYISFEAYRNGNAYTFYFDDLSNKCVKSLAAVNEDVWLWHRRLEHANFDLISKLSNKGLIRGLPKLKPPKEVDSDKCM